MQQARAENAVSGTGDRLKNTALALIDEVTSDAQKSSFAEPILSPMDDAQFLRSIGIRY